MLKHYHGIVVFMLTCFSGWTQTCTLSQADLLAAPAGTYTIAAGEVLCINSNFCMGAASNFPGACANTGISSIIVNGTLRIMDNVSFNFAGALNGTGSIEILEGGRISLFGSINCSGMQIKVIDKTITTGTSSNILNACTSPACETEYSPGYRPFGVVTNGLGFTATGCTLTGYPDNKILLPVSWMDISGYAAGSAVQLNWSTGSEQHNKGFEVQRLNVAGNWEQAGWVPSRAIDGNSSNSLAYSFRDNQPAGMAVQQYRLKQIDIDNRFSFSSIVRVDGLRSSDWKVSAEGNHITIQVQSAVPDNAIITVVSASGVHQYKGNHTLNPGSNRIVLPAGSFSKGIQVVTLLRNGGVTKRQKVLLR